MIFQTLNYRKTGNVIIIDIIDHSGDQSKLIRLSDELIELCDKIMHEEDTRVIIISGASEKSFSLETNSIRPFPGAIDEQWKKSWSLAEPIAKLDKPVIAAIRGDAIGLGLELALACDLRICAETAHFAINHITYGDIPWDGGTQRLSRLVGRSKALEMILIGERIDASEAYRIGLVHRVIPYDKVATVAMDMARNMAPKGPIALRYAKEAVNKGMDLTLEQGLRLEADIYFLLHTTRDRTEGIRAFQEKRPPHFEGR
jgi:methylglutaconyl-CoA hydratase